MAGDEIAKGCAKQEGEITANVVYSVVFQCLGDDVAFEVFSVKGDRSPDDVVADMIGAASKLRSEWEIKSISEEVCREPRYLSLEDVLKGKTR